MISTIRINAGLYQFCLRGRTFQVEDIKRASDGNCGAGWIAYEMYGNRREYLNDYATKRTAVERTVIDVVNGF
jgi:hypothetical protein